MCPNIYICNGKLVHFFWQNETEYDKYFIVATQGGQAFISSEACK